MDETSLLGLAGKKALVIGGGQGMGESTAVILARAGCDVAVLDVVAERADPVAAAVGKLGRRGIPIVGDVLDPASVALLVKQAETELGGIDTMVSALDSSAHA